MLSAGILLTACGPLGLRRQPAAPLGLGAETREQPALSGDGRLLASLVERGGRTTVLLQDRRSGQVLPLRHLRRQQPHSSPSLSWTGRYLAVLVQQGPHRQAVIEDRASGRLHPLFLPAGREPQRLSLAPDGRRLAVELLDNGQRRVELFDLSALLEPDLAPGQLQSGGGPGVAP
jgi:Tol biopolymer transport system component